MRIAMFTNTYLPQVGGVAQSVRRFAEGLRRRGHEVLVVAPEYDARPAGEQRVVRVRAIQNFNGSDFSVALPPGLEVGRRMDELAPEVVHSHHPFLLGDTALRLSGSRRLPLVFTHHAMYERFTHYVPLDSHTLKDYVVELATGYANLCSAVIAPSESTAETLRRRGVSAPLHVVPTGVDVGAFADGAGAPARFRGRMGLPEEAFVIGHVGRLAPEKNLDFLTRAVAAAMGEVPEARFLVVGSGEAGERMRELLGDAGMAGRARFAGTLEGDDLIEAYRAMDAFVFASTSETQGMVLVEALAAGCPVVALDAPGVGEVVADGENGRLVGAEDVPAFAEAVVALARLPGQRRAALRRRARASARPFDIARCADRLVETYRRAAANDGRARSLSERARSRLMDGLRREWALWANRVSSAAKAVAAQATGRGEDKRQ